VKIKIELETSEAETFEALGRLEYFADRIREAAALFQGKIIDEMAADFPWPPAWPSQSSNEDDDAEDDDDDDADDADEADNDVENAQEHEEETEDEYSDYDTDVSDADPWPDWNEEEWEAEQSLPVAATKVESFWSPGKVDSREIESQEIEVVPHEPEYLKQEAVAASAVSTSQLPKLSEESRAVGLQAFEDLVALWATNFDQDGEQPDRLEALRLAGTGRCVVPILVMAYEAKSLQKLVERALIARGLFDASVEAREARLDFADRIAGNMVQISHMCFPDLAGTYDYSTKWRRE